MLIRLAGLALLLAAQASAVDWKALKPEGYVSDFARVVDAGNRAEIERYCDAVKQSTGAEIALVTVQSLEGEAIEDAADAIFRSWGVGDKGKNNGVLLLLSIGDRRSRLEVGYEIEPILTDAYSGRVLDSMRPELKTGRYGAALIEAANTIGNEIAKAKGVAIAGSPRRERREAAEWTEWLPPALFVIAMIWMMSRRRGGGGRHGGIWALPMLGGWGGGGSYGGSGRGGFGGYDSGGGFGGFGGGDSGGGGASSDW